MRRQKVFVMCFLLMLLLGLFVNVVWASDLYEYYNTDDDGAEYIYGTGSYAAQTFTTSEAHTVTSVKLLLYRGGSPGTVTVSITATVAGVPFGDALTDGTTDGNTLTNETTGEWREVSLTEYSLSEGVTYAVLVQALDGDYDNKIRWRWDTTGEYADGTAYSYYSSQWWLDTDKDFMFENWGNPPPEPPPDTENLQITNMLPADESTHYQPSVNFSCIPISNMSAVIDMSLRIYDSGGLYASDAWIDFANGTLCSSVSGSEFSPIPFGTYWFNFTAETNETTTYSPTYTITVVSGVVEGSGIDYYFRSDTYETLGVSAYGLDTDYTNAYLTSNATFPLIYGFRAWLVSSAIVSTELTSGTPTAWIYLNGSETYDSYSSTWLCNETTVNLGYQALKITVYASADAEEWTALASYITPVLITKQIEESEWTFTLQVAFDGANAVYSWGDSTHRSGISGIEMLTPLESEIQLWRINTGDYVGFILGAYIDVIGEAFYVLCLIGVAGTFYFRYRNFGVIVFFFSIFGGVGGLVWFLVPPWAAAVASALIIIGTSFIVWRVVR